MDQCAIIGAGMAGITAARDLRARGHAVTVFDKSRGLGGRLATRRGEGFALDHGAPGVAARDAGFSAVLAETSGIACPEYGVVGQPGMSSLVKEMAVGLEVNGGLEITSLEDTGSGLVLSDGTGQQHGPFDRVISAIPAPQARRFTSHVTDADQALARVRMAPQWALLMAFDAPVAVTTPYPETFEKIIHNSAKPGRAGPPDTWVAHATPDWTRAHLEDDRAEVEAALWAAFGTCAPGLPPPTYRALHRWLYSRTEVPLGAPFLSVLGGRLLIGGDWALGPDAEHAFLSGRAMAAA